jgi:DNA-binding PucR family transcriptional regulator
MDDAVAALRAELPRLEATLMDRMRAEIPLFARPLEGAYGRDVRTTTRALFEGFVMRLEDPTADRDWERERNRDYGRRQVRVGATLEDLLAAYRIASRLLWHCLADLGERLGRDRRWLLEVGDAALAYIDEFSVAAAEGYAEEQARRAGERAWHDEQLLGPLLREPATDPAALETVAEAAGWNPPERLAALAVPGGGDPGLPRRLPGGALVGLRGDLLCALLSDPDAPGEHARLRHALGDARGALGHTVHWTEAAQSFRRAALASQLLDAGVLTARDGLLVTDEHLLALHLHSDPELLGDLARRALAPLDSLRPVVRDRLLATLRCWLDLHGHQGAMAHELGVHQQTVRYRLAQLRDLLGSQMEDPEQRLVLGLALRSR